MAIISDALQSKFTSIQKYEEIIQDYTRLFQTATEVLEYHLVGPLEYVNKMEG